MKAFLTWYEGKTTGIEPLIRAGLAHLYFVTIHPFEDGNGRIARAVTEMSLARLEDSAQRFYSMSSQIREERKAYYQKMESTQKGGMDVTEWLVWFLDCLSRAIDKANELTGGVLAKKAFWRHLRQKAIVVSERQKKIINQLLDGFEGKLTIEKWAKLAKISHDTLMRYSGFDQERNFETRRKWREKHRVCPDPRANNLKRAQGKEQHDRRLQHENIAPVQAIVSLRLCRGQPRLRSAQAPGRDCGVPRALSCPADEPHLAKQPPVQMSLGQQQPVA